MRGFRAAARRVHARGAGVGGRVAAANGRRRVAAIGVGGGRADGDEQPERHGTYRSGRCGDRYEERICRSLETMLDLSFAEANGSPVRATDGSRVDAGSGEGPRTLRSCC